MDNDRRSGIFTYLGQDRDKTKTAHVANALAISASVVIVLAGIKYASGLVGPMLLALFLAIVLLIPLRWLQKHGCPQLLAFLFVLVCSIALFVGIIYFVSQSLNDFIGSIPTYKDRVVQRYNQLENNLEKWGFQIGTWRNILPGDKKETKKQTVKESGQKPAAEPAVKEPVEEAKQETAKPKEESPAPAVDPPLPSLLIEEWEGVPPESADEDETAEPHSADDTIDREAAGKKTAEKKVAEAEPPLVWEDVKPVPIEEVAKLVESSKPELIALDPQSVMLWIAKGALQIRHTLEGGFIVLIFTIFMLFEASHFPAKVDRAFGKDGLINNEQFHRIADDVRRYLVLKTLANLMSGSAAMLVYFVFGVPGAFFWGIVAFFMYYIPNIGGTLAAVIPGILIFMNHDITGVMMYAVCLVAIECSIAYGIEPKMLGHGLRLSTMVIILTLFFWGFILGPIGLFLAAPLTVMLKILLQTFPETRWLAIFLDDNRKT